MKRFKSTVMAGFALALTVVSALSALPVSAQSSASLGVEPKKNYVIEPGKSVKDKTTIRNLDAQHSLTLNLRLVDFTYTNDTGTPKLMLDENAPQTTWSLKPYLTVPKTVEIPASSSKTIDINVAMPSNLGAGSYYSAILYSTGAADGGNVGLSASGVTLVFAQVPGKVNENLDVKNFGAYFDANAKEAAHYSWFTMDMPQKLAYTLENKGNVTEAPIGSITLTNAFGYKNTINNVNPNQSLALIGQTRTFTACVKQKDQDVNLGGSASKSVVCVNPGLWPGLYNAKLDVFYGQNGNTTQEIVKNASFLYMPAWALLVLIVLLIVIVLAVLRLMTLFRRKFGKTATRK